MTATLCKPWYASNQLALNCSLCNDCTLREHGLVEVAAWEQYARQTFTFCALFGKPCTQDSLKHRLLTAAAGKMAANLPRWHILIALSCATLVGLILDPLLWRPSTNRSPSQPSRRRHRTAYDHCATAWSEAVPMSAEDAVISIKFLVLALLWLELEFLTAHDQSFLAVPELIALQRVHPARSGAKRLVPPLTQLLMPSLCDATADMWAERLSKLRLLLLLAWGGYLLVPSAHSRASSLLYAAGAAAYFVLGSIGLMCHHGNSMQGPMIFMLSAASAVGDRSPRAGSWLRQFVIAAILVPTYLFAGISKLRYFGVASNLTGEWIRPVLLDRAQSDSLLPALNAALASSRMGLGLLSCANLSLELLLPIACLCARSGRTATAIRRLALPCWAAFHLANFVLIGPNFSRQLLLLLFASNPLGWRHGAPPLHVERTSATTGMDCLRAAILVAVLSGWFAVQVASDVAHLSGTWSLDAKFNPVWPWPELSMFTDASAQQSEYLTSAALVGAILFGVLLNTCNQRQHLRRQRQHQTDDDEDEQQAVLLT